MVMSGGQLIDHIGILVPDLEAAIKRWSAVMGYTFSPIARYRTPSYSDHSNPEPHFHDTRISFSKEGPPYIELLSITGSGTHGPDEAGVHHFGIRGIEDVDARIAECAALGIGEDGKSVMPDGRVHLWFTEKRDLDGIRLEFIAPINGPTVADDGAELPIDPETGRNSLWGSR
jgi:catechol 2,3-dioxygenase-like lactoylglutathione lyase family enzyme